VLSRYPDQQVEKREDVGYARKSAGKVVFRSLQANTWVQRAEAFRKEIFVYSPGPRDRRKVRARLHSEPANARGRIRAVTGIPNATDAPAPVVRPKVPFVATDFVLFFLWNCTRTKRVYSTTSGNGICRFRFGAKPRQCFSTRFKKERALIGLVM
jgi:hypothetical protein